MAAKPLNDLDGILVQVGDPPPQSQAPPQAQQSQQVAQVHGAGAYAEIEGAVSPLRKKPNGNNPNPLQPPPLDLDQVEVEIVPSYQNQTAEDIESGNSNVYQGGILVIRGSCHPKILYMTFSFVSRPRSHRLGWVLHLGRV